MALPGIGTFGPGPVTNQDLQNLDTQVNEDSVPQEEDAATVTGVMETEESAAPPPPESESLSLSDMPDFYAETGLLEGSDPVTEEELENTEEREAFVRDKEPVGRILIEENRRERLGETETIFPEADPGRLGEMGRRFESGTESFTGLELQQSEKPYIAATLAAEIANCFAKKNVIFVRKFTSDRGISEKYTLLRKRIFWEGEFVEIASMEGSSFIVPEKYKKHVEIIGLPEDRLIIFEDADIQPNEVYIYKVVLDWDLGSNSEGLVPSTSIAREVVEGSAAALLGIL